MNLTGKITLIALATTLFAVGCSGDRPTQEMSHEKSYKFLTHRVDDTLDDLDADDTQRGKVHTLKDDLFDKGIAFRDAGQQSRKAAIAEFRKEQPDSEKLHGLVDERVDAFRKLAHDVTDDAIELHGVLTPDQREELLTMIEERMSRQR